MFSTVMAHRLEGVPGPKYQVEGTSTPKHSRTTFTTSTRMDLSKPQNENPGPEYQVGRFYTPCI